LPIEVKPTEELPVEATTQLKTFLKNKKTTLFKCQLGTPDTQTDIAQKLVQNLLKNSKNKQQKWKFFLNEQTEEKALFIQCNK
jgi:hypothetical protein